MRKGWKCQPESAGLKQPGRVLRCINGNFLTQVNEPTLYQQTRLRRRAGLGQHGLGSPWDGRWSFFPKPGSQPPERTDFGLFRDLLWWICWDITLEKNKVQGSCLILKDHLLQAPELSISICRETSTGSRRPTRMNKLLLAKLNHEMEVHKRWKQSQKGLGKPKPTWSWIHWGLTKAARRVSTGTPAKRACCCLGR